MSEKRVEVWMLLEMHDEKKEKSNETNFGSKVPKASRYSKLIEFK